MGLTNIAYLKPLNPKDLPMPVYWISSLSRALSEMKLLRSNPWRGYGISRVLSAFFYSTRTLSRNPPPIDALHRRIWRAGDPRVPIIRVIDQWIEEGKHIEESDLFRTMKELRRYRRYKHALEICEWLSDRTNHGRPPGDIAIQLDLISKVHGLDEAEKYFGSIPDSSRILQVYGALLNCYAEHKSLDKAEATMQKMRELDFLKSSLSYNVMLSLYSRMGKTEKLDILTQEMEEKGIEWDKFTFNIRLKAYAATSDIEGMEKLLMKMEADPVIIIDWNAYVVAANGYLKAGLHGKTLEMVKKAEQHVSSKSRRSAYEIFLTLYTAIQNKDEVYRMWDLYRNMGKVLNSGYICMISSLVKLDDIDGAKKIFEEWESGDTFFDIRVPRVLIIGYCKKGLLEEAEACINRLVESGRELDSIMWERMATGYRAHGQMEKAVETLKKAFLAGEARWRPNRYILGSCVEYLKEQGNVEGSEEILRLLRDHCHLSTDIDERLLKYISSVNPGSRASDYLEGDDQVEGDDQDVDGETLGGNGVTNGPQA